MRVLVLLATLIACTASQAAAAQTSGGTVRLRVTSGGQPVEGAVATIARTTRTTDTRGEAIFTLAAGTFSASVRKPGLVPVDVPVTAVAGAESVVDVTLDALPVVEEEVTVVGATRNERRVEDQAMRVEVLPREEIEEKLMMTPGDIVMMLNEMGGMRVQTTSPSLGAASVRIQGMRGRYTRVLSDGLPLFGDVGGLGLLQIPPMDLGQVEVIKGVASALYGAGAMGGVVNLVSRRPGLRPAHEVLVNRSTRGATDTVVFTSSPLRGRWSGTLLAGGHWQSENDVDDDGWSDLPGYERAVVRPRVFWDAGDGRSLFATAGFTGEARTGGTAEDKTLAATSFPYLESLDTRRYDAGVIGQAVVGGRYVVTARAALTTQRHDHLFGDSIERDRHDTTFAEVAIRGSAGRHVWVAGGAFQRDAFSARDLPAFDYRFNVPGVFGQYDMDLNPVITLSTSGRLDVHSEYGVFGSPRVSLLVRRGGWTGRASVGTGFFAPTPITEETEAAGLRRLTVRGPLEAERGLSASFDLTRRQGPLSYTATLFASRVSDPVHVDRDPSYVLRNLNDPTNNVGVELLATARRDRFALTATYTYVHARETVDGRAQNVALTPRRSAGVVGMWEAEGRGRAGLEFYFTGEQALEQNPYRSTSRPYVVVGALVERQLGRVRLFLNGENLSDVRQTKWDPLLSPTRGADGRWAVDSWSPLEGRNINGGIRVVF